MNTYELTYIIPDKFSEKEIPQISERVKKLLPDGRVLKENLWGRRRLAYPIKKNDWGFYVTLVFETEPETMEKIKAKLKLEEDVIRYLIVRVFAKPKEEKKVIKVEEKPKIKVKARPKMVTKPKKAKIEKEETEEKKMKDLEEKLEEILKE